MVVVVPDDTPDVDPDDDGDDVPGAEPATVLPDATVPEVMSVVATVPDDDVEDSDVEVPLAEPAGRGLQGEAATRAADARTDRTAAETFMFVVCSFGGEEKVND